MKAVNKVMIGTAGTVDLHVTSTTGYEDRQQWGGREDSSAAVFDQWLNACESSLKILEESRLGNLGLPPCTLDLIYAKNSLCSKAIGLGFESQSSFLSL